MDPNEKKDMNENITNSSAEEQKKDETCIEETSGEVNLQEEKLQNELNELNDKYIRLLAEFDNFKRRTAKERIDLIKTASADVLRSMLSVMDDFDRANKSTSEAKDIDAVKEGINLVHSKLKNTLAQQGLREMESQIGKDFDTDLHEAITNVPASDESMRGKVIDELEKGYYLNDKVIRFAKVIVGS
jgi:molecular chaperone GrpE